ncbi:DUF72 domain-containing protein [Luteimonas fraxinea]|uniref:DUF72 domain-containing protein n=1 Tax=Luteimonas fraxinea TaxID=2901869 RepID=A0ABS8UFQ8_9GAMM|nr:DUF72 domain-containing protein [Luteimonas fraxinea]MCD9098348.1 DUF72 domain-containing protein [Luteimonas fraxinea]UHH11903.1 DUF72 domain-containing protein [Luteimonas fraxinea]
MRIGCAGWSIASRDAALFGAGGSMLARYATRFDAVEINSSFYKPHRATTYARWAESVPAGFRFSIKLPKTITHDARLAGCGAALDAFLEAASGLGDKLDCVLVQLPPSLAFDARTAATFFAMLARRWPGRVACEARHASWLMPQPDALLARHHVARVAADPARHGGDAQPGGSARFGYWRWHGRPKIYYSDYDADALDAIATAVRAGPADAWVVFDNTAVGHAIPNAAALQARLG